MSAGSIVAEKRVCVFCASSDGNDPALRHAAAALGRGLAERKLGLVYGGANVGMMAAVADSALAHGGEAIGIIPGALVEREVAHHRLTRLEVVRSMHERKARMEALSDAFVTLPGGLGTLDETAEMLTWAQLGIHAKPCFMLNHDGFFDHLLAFLRTAVARGVLRQENYELLRVTSTVPELLQQLERL